MDSETGKLIYETAIATSLSFHIALGLFTPIISKNSEKIQNQTEKQDIIARYLLSKI